MNRPHLRALLIVSGFSLLLVGLFIWGQIVERTNFLDPADAESEIARLEAGLPADVTLPPIRSSDPSRGSTSSASLLVVEFGDFNCLSCRLLEPELRRAMQAFPQDARLVWRDLPLNADQTDGLLPALAARCAQDQGKFWEMHDALFATAKLDQKGVRAAAQNANLNLSQFDTCLSTNKHKEELLAELQLARNSGISSPPTLFIGNQVIDGFAKAQDIAEIINQTLNKRSPGAR